MQQVLKLTDLTADAIAAQLELKAFQGKQIFRWLHFKQTFDIDAMTDLSKELRQRLKESCRTHQLDLAHLSTSTLSEGTRKALFRLHDGETVEAVLIKDSDRVTICLSTQVGCAVKCSFCATGLSGFTRNLTPGEIVEQALYLLANENMGEKHPNIVYMGMGEPFRNYENTVASIRLLMSKDGLNLGARKITVSTAGEVDGIRRFADENWQVRLSVSLHAANNELRNELVPLNRKYPLEKLMDSVRDYIAKTGRHITFEWALLKDVNDRDQDIAELSGLIEDRSITVNLIPYNPVHGLGYTAPSRKRCEEFRNALEAKGITATLRKERGQDIDAACGQLRRQHLAEV
jgi:23S rRNA (adenine2503-C2)-methyltransferase